MNTNLKYLIGPTFIILIATLMRLLPHLPNFTPLAAMALFSGVYLNKKFAFVIPLSVMFISDIFLGFHDTMIYVYGSFIITAFIGLSLKKNKTTKNVISSALFSSILFFVITNFGVWAQGWYPRTIEGLAQSYMMAIPFFKNTLLGDMFYTGLFFGGYELAKNLLGKFELNKV